MTSLDKAKALQAIAALINTGAPNNDVLSECINALFDGIIDESSTQTLTNKTLSGSENTFNDLIFPTSAMQTIAAGVGGAINITSFCTRISADAGGDAFTLANGSFIGQIKKIFFSATAGGTAVVTGAFTGANNTLTFTNAGEYAILRWDGTDWIAIELSSNTSNTQLPAISTV